MPREDTSALIGRLNAKALEKGLRVVCASELARGKSKDPAKADVLVMSMPVPVADTGCMVLVPVAGRGEFTRAAKLTLNGVAGHIGPAPNERLGMVDIMFTADMRARDNPGYTGRHLFSDLLHGREIAVWCRSMENTEHTGSALLGRMQFARFTVFDAPIDRELAESLGHTLFAGNTVLLNGGLGLIAGSGVRGSAKAPSLTVFADLFPMREDLLLCDAAGILDRHNLTFAIPLALVPDPETVLSRAAALALSGGNEVGSRLAASENLLAGAVASGKHRLPDPGPGAQAVTACAASA